MMSVMERLRKRLLKYLDAELEADKALVSLCKDLEKVEQELIDLGYPYLEIDADSYEEYLRSARKETSNVKGRINQAKTLKEFLEILGSLSSINVERRKRNLGVYI